MVSMRLICSSALFFLILALAEDNNKGVVLGAEEGEDDDSRTVHIYNASPEPIEIYWINPQNGELDLFTEPTLNPDQEFGIGTWIGQSWQIMELCDDDDCRAATFVVKDDTAVVSVKKGLILEYTQKLNDPNLEYDEQGGSVEECERKMRLGLEEGTLQSEDDAKHQFVRCVKGGLIKKIMEHDEEMSFQFQMIDTVGDIWEDYTCAGDDLPTSKSVDERVWENEKENKSYNVHIMHERPASKIHLLDDFITEEECKAMEEAAKDDLHRASVADDKGGSEYSEARKAMQAGVEVPWNEPDNPITRLSHRVYDYTNHVLNLGIKEDGQEELMSIQYTGRGLNDTEPDRYMPHCDGDCDGFPFKPGNRMATMVLYCTVATKGGATNFKNAGVHVKPKLHAGTFFSYMDPETKIMDKGFTIHSGCPVLEGEKKIVTQWIRLGVDWENPWDSFNTLGVKITEEDEYTDANESEDGEEDDEDEGEEEDEYLSEDEDEESERDEYESDSGIPYGEPA